MKSLKNTIKHGGRYVPSTNANLTLSGVVVEDSANNLSSQFVYFDDPRQASFIEQKRAKLAESYIQQNVKGGSKRKSRKSKKSRKAKKTKKRRGSHEGGKKKCPKHCRRKTSRTRKSFKHRKN